MIISIRDRPSHVRLALARTTIFLNFAPKRGGIIDYRILGTINHRCLRSATTSLMTGGGGGGRGVSLEIKDQLQINYSNLQYLVIISIVIVIFLIIFLIIFIVIFVVRHLNYPYGWRSYCLRFCEKNQGQKVFSFFSGFQHSNVYFSSIEHYLWNTEGLDIKDFISSFWRIVRYIESDTKLL